MSENKNIDMLTPAEKFYKKHLEHVAKYQRNHKEKVNKISNKSYHRMIADEEKEKEFKEKRRQYYINVVKPRKLKIASEGNN